VYKGKFVTQGVYEYMMARVVDILEEVYSLKVIAYPALF
jgi:hypothetical protein